MNLSGLPNAICIARMLLAVPIVWLLNNDRAGEALLLFTIAAVSDGLDGFLAKRFHWESELGKILDPLADKLLLVATFVTLALNGLAPLWLALTAIARDLLITAGAITYQLLFGSPRGHPTWISKANTVLQLAFVIAVLLSAAGLPVPAVGLLVLGAVTFVTTVVSGLDYVLTYSRRAAAAARARRGAA